MSHSKGRSLARLTIAGAVAVGATFAVSGTAVAAPGAVWDRLAECESGGNWSINTGNGYYGGLQFSASTWRAFGGTGMPHQASRAQQIAVAERTLATQGWGAWPACSSKLGLRGYAAEPDRAVRTSSEPASEPAAEPTQSSGGGNYTVKAGDTLGTIAAAHGTSWETIYANNRDVISDPDMIMPGWTLDV